MAGTNASGRKGKTPKKEAEVVREFTAMCPDWMPETGRAYWFTIVPKLTARNVLTDLDAFAVERLCQLHADWHGCVDIINKEGQFCVHVHDRGNENTVIHPAVKLKKDIEAELTRLSAKFGLTPRDREAIKAHKGKTSKSIRNQH